MKPFANILVVVGVASALAGASAVCAETVHFTDGTRMEVASYEIRDNVVILLTSDGKLRSVPRSYVDLDALVDKEALVAEAIELMGLRRLTDEIASSARQAAAGIDEGSPTSKMLVDAMSEGFASERIYRVAEETFREKATGVRLGAALEWLRSPFARRMERAESSGTRDSLDSYIAGLESAPPSGDRVELLLRLDHASGTSDAAVEMQVAMMKALLQGMYLSGQAGPAGQAGPGADHAIEQAVEQARPKLRRKTRNRIQLSLHFMYRDVSDDELAQYLAYLESEDGEWLRRVLLKALFAAMEEGARRSGEVLAERLTELTKLQV